MRKTIPIITFILTLVSCSKDKPAYIPPVAQLPAETHYGANTFGCLIDGQILKPSLRSNSYNCIYQLVNGEYYFHVTASNDKANILTAISIGTEKLQISEGEILSLEDRINGKCFGGYFKGNRNTGIIENYYTVPPNTGELIITKLDFSNNIVSGTFWFDIEDNQHVIHQIRNGRFDMHFTQ